MCEWDHGDTDASATHQPNRYSPSNRHIVYRRPRSAFSVVVPEERGRTTHRHCPSTPAQSQPSPSLNVRPSSPSDPSTSGAAGGNPGTEHDLSPSRLRNARSTSWWRSLLSRLRRLSSITWRAAAIHAQSKRSSWSSGIPGLCVPCVADEPGA